MAANSANVTIGKDYFDVLLRKAQANENGVPGPSANTLTVTIPKVDHDNLLNTARQLENLRRNLFRGGVTEETLFILSSDEPPSEEDTTNGVQKNRRFGDRLENQSIEAQGNSQAYNNPSANRQQNYTFGSNGTYGQHETKQYNSFQSHHHGFDEPLYMPDSNGGLEYSNGNFFVEQSEQQRPRYKRDAKRTIILAHLAEGTTHADVVENVKGGMLLDIYLRNDHSCAVSFLDEDDARAFFGHSKRNDLYIRDKRVEVRWSERHFILPGHVANKISIGATRTVIIRNANSSHTEESIRSHAEHIHNLVVISVIFQGRNILIDCNSVHNAMYLRTCLMSRASYKGSKIEWDVDECASPLPMPVRLPKKENVQAKKTAATLNRFQLLNMDGTENGSEEDDEDENDISAETLITTTTGVLAGSSFR